MSAVAVNRVEPHPNGIVGALPAPRRILVWSPNYAPELTGIPPLVTDACEWLAERGHLVEVVTAMPNYPQREILDDYRGAIWRSERHGPVDIHRSWLRVRRQETFLDKVLYELTFAGCSLPRVMRRLRVSDVVVCVVPSLLAATAVAFARSLLPVAQRPRLVLWVQDLVLSGALALDGLGALQRRLLSSASRLERLAARGADRIVVCSPGFREYLVAHGVQPERITTLPNWVDVNWITPTPLPARRRTRFLYAGNLGYSQGFETLVEAGARAGDGIEIEIVGEGNAGGHLRSLAATSERVTVQGPVAREAFPQLLASADAHVVLQRGISAGANLPSKIASYLASGRPIVASIDLRSAAAEMLRASGGALLVQPDSPEALAGAMRTLSDRPDVRAALAESGRRYAVEQLAKGRTLARLEQELIA
jgi:colanic acid biosynthesis glycosyl transferase WcaI